MIYPKKTQYKEDAKFFKVIPVFKEIRADFETPLSIFLKIKAHFLLESIERGENVGRYSMIAKGKKCVIKCNGHLIEINEYNNNKNGKTKKQTFELKNPLNKVKEYFSELKSPDYEGLPLFFGGIIGYLGYETIQYFEDVPVIEGDTGIPDSLMVIPEVVLVYDSVKRSVFIVVSTIPGKEVESTYRYAVKRIEAIAASLSTSLDYIKNRKNNKKINIEQNMEKAYFLDCVNRCKEYINEGEIIQVVFSQRFSVNTSVSPFAIYQDLRILNPSPYLFFLDFDDFYLIGSSPEVMVKVQNREILIKPIAGTKRRGHSISEDNQLANELLEDPKERAEHMMLVDLGRNDLGRVAAAGSVEVTEFMNIEKYSHVMHIVSTIKGELDEPYDIFDVIRATFPAGTLTGAPKIRAMEIVSELEPCKRGPYGGMVFYLGFNGNLDSCITIRTIILKNGLALIQAGAGIVADSIPENEYNETLNKAQALIKAIKKAECGG